MASFPAADNWLLQRYPLLSRYVGLNLAEIVLAFKN